MNTFSTFLCILVAIIIKPSSSTLSDLFGGGEPAPAPQPLPQIRQLQQFGQLAQQLQQFAPNPGQILGQIGQYGPQLLELANQAQKFFSDDDNNDSPQQQQQSPQFGKPSFQQGPGQGLGQGQGQGQGLGLGQGQGQGGQGQGLGQKFGPPARPQQQQFRQQQQQLNSQSPPPFNILNKFAPQSQSGGDSYNGNGLELSSPPEVVHVHHHIIEHRGQSGFGSGSGYEGGNGGSSGYEGGNGGYGESRNNGNGQNVRVFKIIHEQGNGLGNGYGNGGGGHGGGQGNGIEQQGWNGWD